MKGLSSKRVPVEKNLHPLLGSSRSHITPASHPPQSQATGAQKHEKPGQRLQARTVVNVGNHRHVTDLLRPVHDGPKHRNRKVHLPHADDKSRCASHKHTHSTARTVPALPPHPAACTGLGDHHCARMTTTPSNWGESKVRARASFEEASFFMVFFAREPPVLGTPPNCQKIRTFTPVAGLIFELIFDAGRRTDFRDKKSRDFSGEIFLERFFWSSITARTTLFPSISCGVDSFSPN